MIVELSAPEMFLATMVGCARQWQNVDAGRQDRYGFEGDPWASHIESSRAECAVAKALNVFWSGSVGNLKAADVGKVQVRHRIHDLEQPIGRISLTLHPRDNDGDLFVLVCGRRGKYKIMGFLRAEQGKKPKYWCDPTGRGRPAFFVPADLLIPFNEIADIAK
ncbi:MAG: hypothetical protein WCP82_05000 [Alphaproteobacteria bacterium]